MLRTRSRILLVQSGVICDGDSKKLGKVRMFGTRSRTYDDEDDDVASNYILDHDDDDIMIMVMMVT